MKSNKATIDEIVIDMGASDKALRFDDLLRENMRVVNFDNGGIVPRREKW